ncbi:Molybdopterin biosynthesis protein MoeA [hydrothermal vent metagenome]|uniref:Molybdopterin biosynthesis protein MoeA n=1 Tax=hydrothermal vent metagenome TaxID=652676 RepID=A0A3B1E5E4_9ZZZZ
MKKKFITYNESKKILNDLNIQPNKIEKLFISDSLNRVLAQDIVADENSPVSPTSAMDGYAIKYEDIKLDKIKIIGNNPAGSVVNSNVVNKTCIKTFTGSLMPAGSDTLIPIENVTVVEDYIIINKKVTNGFAVRNIGENYIKNQILIKKHTVIDFVEIGVMASLNISHVEVFIKPIVAIASTGSEILDLGERQTNNAQIRSSNHLTLQAIAAKYGASVNQLGVIKDDKSSILNVLQNALKTSDIVVTTGGVSVGDYDFVKDIIKDELGCEVLFQGVLIKPGQHIILAKKQFNNNTKFIVGLPGFAYSSTVTFLLYVMPLIFKFKGANEFINIKEAVIECDVSKSRGKTAFTACNLEYRDSQYYLNTNGKKKGTSAILTNMLGNVGLLIQEQDDLDVRYGDKVRFLSIY